MNCPWCGGSVKTRIRLKIEPDCDGEKEYYQPRGELNYFCNSCHYEQYPKGMPNKFEDLKEYLDKQLEEVIFVMPENGI